MSIIDRLLENEEIFKAMLSMPDSMNRQLPRARREELFSFMWENTDMERREVMNLVNQQELVVVREFDHHDIPEWLLRLQAQDMLMEYMHEKFKEEGLI